MSRSRKKNWRYFNGDEESSSYASSSHASNSRVSNPRSSSSSAGRDQRDRPPSELRGREIGLWHRKRRMEINAREAVKRGFDIDNPEERSQMKAEITASRNEATEKRPLGSILISDKKKENLNQLIKETASIYPSSFMNKDNTYEHLEETDFKHEFLQHITGSIIQKLEAIPDIRTQWKNDILDQTFLQELKEKEFSNSYQKMLGVRKRLPSMGMRDEILDLIDKNQVIVISGETGCGKTTQVAQFILDDYIKKGNGSECRIVCTQPRRISAISVAERVAQERDEKLGASVGYQIRLEQVKPRDRGSILFCTAGVLLKYMESRPSLNGVSHLLLDEIHERDIISDFLITLLKDVIKYRSDIKIILMSATLNSEAFSKYYNHAPHVNIPGFTYPVEEFFLEDVLQLTGYTFKENRIPWKKRQDWSTYMEPYIRQLEADKKYTRDVINQLRKFESEQLDVDLIFQLILKICELDNDEGSILVFVPGFSEISNISKKIEESREFSPAKYIVIPLHSQLPTVDQKRIFNPAPKGMRKIIISTNIAETSITIDDVTTVIDCGFIKMTNIDPETGMQTLQSEWVSQANAAQRKGRAGRVKAGVCYHLVTKVRYQLLDKFLKPEVLRKRLDDVILQLKILQLGDAEPFLAKLMDPPDYRSVQAARSLLQRLGALDDHEGLTPLGFHMAKLTVDSQCAKMLIMAALFSCIDPILSVAASLGFKEAQLLSMDAKEVDAKKLELSNGTNSDHLTMHYAIEGFENARDPRGFCRKYFLSSSILRMLTDLRKQFAKELFDLKFISDSSPRSPSNNLNSDNIGIVKAVIAAGLYPNIAIVGKVGKYNIKIRSVEHTSMKIHLKSVLKATKNFPAPLIMYYLRLKSSSVFIHDGTVVFPLPIVFFGDKFRVHSDQDNNDSFNGVSVNGTIRFICTESTSLVLKNLRERLNQILEWKVCHPGNINWNSSTPEVKLLR